MRQELIKIFSKTEVTDNVVEYFKIRRQRVSLMFIGFIFIAVVLISPITLLVLKNYTASYGAVGIGALAVVSILLVIRGRDRLGSALLLSGISAIFGIIVAVPAFSHSPEYHSVLTSLVGLGLILLFPSGFMVNGPFALGLSVFFSAFYAVCTTVSALPEIQSRRSILIVVFLVGGAIVYFITRLQDSLLNRSVEHTTRSIRTLASLSALVARIAVLKREADASGAAVQAAFASVGTGMRSFIDKNQELFAASSALGAAAETAQKNLSVLRRAVAGINDSAERQKSLVDAQTVSQQRINDAFIQIGEEMAQADEATKRLAAMAEDGRGTLEKATASVKGLVDYQSKTLEIVGTLAKISSQTNLLAMNAAIEAAHAGSTGAGFAVVAESVRDLADSSGARTKEITNLVRTMNGEISVGSKQIEAVAAMLFQVIAEAKRTYGLIEGVRHSVENFASDNQAALESIRAMANLAGAISTNAEDQRRVTEAYTKAFETLTTSFQTISLGIGELNEKNQKSSDILRQAAAAVSDSATLNKTIDELLRENEQEAVPQR